MKRIKVVVVEDHPVYRDGLVAMLRARQGDIEVVGEASDGRTALSVVTETSPDVVLMDVKMRHMDGVEATAQLKARFPDVKVLVLSAYDDDDCVLGMFRAGAAGYMLKDADYALIVSGIRAIYEGDARIHPRLAAKVVKAFSQLSQNGHHTNGSNDGLTERELEVLRMIAGGASNRQVATQLWISVRTVDNHIQSIYRKLDIGDRIQLTLYAIRKGLISAADRAPAVS